YGAAGRRRRRATRRARTGRLSEVLRRRSPLAAQRGPAAGRSGRRGGRPPRARRGAAERGGRARGGPSRLIPITRIREYAGVAEYTFLTTWCVDAPIEAVWEAIYESERWPEWWKGVENVVELESGDADGVGSVSRYTWKSRLPYRLEFDMRTTRVERPHL